MSSPNAELNGSVVSQLQSANAQFAEFAAVLDQTHTIIHKLDGTILYWNSGAESLYGWSREAAMGRKVHELLKTEYSRPLEGIQAELLEHDKWSGECRQHCRDGSVIWVASFLSVRRDTEGEPVSVVRVSNAHNGAETYHRSLAS